MSYEKRPCAHPGCNRLGRNKGWYKDRKRYGRFCERHQRQRNGKDTLVMRHHSIPNKVCVMCGWDKAYCDRHRLDAKKGYEPENVLVLCPNCHRLQHIGAGGHPSNKVVND